MDVRAGLWRKLSAEKLMLLNCGVGGDSWESLGLQGDPISPSWRRSVLGVHWKDWCWSWNSNTLATSCEELTHWKRPWCLEGLGTGGEGDDRGWDGWMASPTQWAWVWVNSGTWWWTGRPGVLRFMGSQRVGHDWETELNSLYLFWIQNAGPFMRGHWWGRGHLAWCMLSYFSRVRLFATLWNVAHQAPRSMGLSRQECWSGLPFPTPGDLPDARIEPLWLMSPALALRHWCEPTFL